MSQTVGDFLLQRVADWGIRRVHGYPGDGISGLMGAMGRMEDRFDYIRVHHEEMSAFMAGGHAKFTGEVGLCLATSGPGTIHLLNGLYDAKMDHVPVVAIVGQQASSSLGSDYQQEVDLHNLFKDVAASYVETIVNQAQVRHVVDRAIRIAAAERTVTCIIVPNDVQEMGAIESPPRTHGNVYSGVGYADPHPTPTDDDLARAAAVLNEGSSVAILAGAGALHATDEVVAVAEALGAGVAKALLGKAAVPDDLPFVTGSIGLLGTRPSWEMMRDCDTLLLVGTTFPYAEFLPKEGQARAVQIDIQPRNFNLRYPTEVNLVGDSAETLRRLIPLLKAKGDGKWRSTIEDNVASWWREVEAKAMEPANPINPQRIFWELSSILPDDAIVCGDSGSHTNWYARNIKMRRGMMGSLSGKLATMGSGVPYAFAAKMAYPDRPVIAISGEVRFDAGSRAHGAPLLPRGGGTSLAGQCCNTAVVVDMSKYLNEITEIRPEAKLARVQPGCVLDDLRQSAERHHLTFGPDPATHAHNTLGGMIGNNSCGVHSVMAGRTADNVRRLEVLTYDGHRMWVGATADDELQAIIRDGGRRGEIHAKLKALRDRYADLIRARYPRIPRRVSGYNFDELLPERSFNVAREGRSLLARVPRPSPALRVRVRALWPFRRWLHPRPHRFRSVQQRRHPALAALPG
ncbi:MAG: thiamine pyrophosphate-requiring protein [Rhodospirillales bacterium]|nr:thiamine pyrophosphate-requiring protein [Rhodospirillales bacterium]